jgi:hypothetical protein
MVTSLSLPLQEELDHLRGDLLRALIQLRIREIGNGMGHGQELIIRMSPCLGHRSACLGEDIRDNGGSRHAILFKKNPVEHTARTARPSISHSGNGDIALGGKFSDHLLRDR